MEAHTVRPEWDENEINAILPWLRTNLTDDAKMKKIREIVRRLLSDVERAEREMERKMFLDLLTTLTREPWQNGWDEAALEDRKEGYNEALAEIRRLLTNPDLTHSRD